MAVKNDGLTRRDFFKGAGLAAAGSAVGLAAAQDEVLGTQKTSRVVLIRDEKVHQIYSTMQAGKKFGMQTLNDALYSLYMRDEVALEEVMRVSPDPVELKRMIGQEEPVTV